jgi:hypothetical protein
MSFNAVLTAVKIVALAKESVAIDGAKNMHDLGRILSALGYEVPDDFGELEVYGPPAPASDKEKLYGLRLEGVDDSKMLRTVRQLRECYRYMSLARARDIFVDARNGLMPTFATQETYGGALRVIDMFAASGAVVTMHEEKG